MRLPSNYFELVEGYVQAVELLARQSRADAERASREVLQLSLGYLRRDGGSPERHEKLAVWHDDKFYRLVNQVDELNASSLLFMRSVGVAFETFCKERGLWVAYLADNQAPMDRLVGLRAAFASLGIVVLAALGCGTATNNTGGASDGGATGRSDAGAIGSPGSIACVNTTCSGAGRNICCVDLAFTPPFLSGTCTGDLATCTQVALACDDVTDCPSTQSCCAYQLGINGMQRTFSSCKPTCGGLTAEREICDRRGAGRCANGAFCCRNASDLLGVCVASEALCVPDAGSP